MGRGRLIWIIALCGLLSGCFLFPTAVKRETLLLPVIESAEQKEPIVCRRMARPLGN